MIIDEVNKGIDIMLHPGEATARKMDIRHALEFYSKLAIIPFVLTVVFYFVFVNSTLLIIPIVLLIFIIVLPVGYFIDAFIYQLFGKFILRQFTTNYRATFSAVVYGSVPSVLFIWLENIPKIGSIFGLILGIWSFIVLLFALSNQQKISKFTAFVVLLISVAALVIVVAIILYALHVF